MATITIKRKAPKKISSKKKSIMSPANVKILKDLEEAIKEMNLIKAGKKKGISMEEFLNEL